MSKRLSRKMTHQISGTTSSPCSSPSIINNIKQNQSTSSSSTVVTPPLVTQSNTLTTPLNSNQVANGQPIVTRITPECFGCHKVIRERFLLRALDQLWHENCLKCTCCAARLGEVGSTLFTKDNLILCKRDYLRLFGLTGSCTACNKKIPAFEMVMRAKGNVYHLECFACQQCNYRFCIGDRFYLLENKILCEYDYEERMVFANLSHTANGLEHIKRQTEILEAASDAASSGYGSSESPYTEHR